MGFLWKEKCMNVIKLVPFIVTEVWYETSVVLYARVIKVECA